MHPALRDCEFDPAAGVCLGVPACPDRDLPGLAAIHDRERIGLKMFQHVHLQPASEFGKEQTDWLPMELARRSHPCDLAELKNRNPVGKRPCLNLVLDDASHRAPERQEWVGTVRAALAAGNRYGVKSASDPGNEPNRAS